MHKHPPKKYSLQFWRTKVTTLAKGCDKCWFSDSVLYPALLHTQCSNETVQIHTRHG